MDEEHSIPPSILHKGPLDYLGQARLQSTNVLIFFVFNRLFFQTTVIVAGRTTILRWPSEVASGKRLHNYGKSQFFMGKSTISMTIFNSYFDITRGYIPMISLNQYKTPLNHHFSLETDRSWLVAHWTNSRLLNPPGPLISPVGREKTRVAAVLQRQSKVLRKGLWMTKIWRTNDVLYIY